MTRGTRVGAASAIAVLASHLILSARQTQTPSQPPPEQPPPVFRAGAALVRVDVTVTNRHGEPVTDLSASDFEVSEDNVPQSVETFKLVSADGRQAEDDDTSLEIRSPEHAAAEAARDDVRVFLIFWDEYHIGRFASAIQARRALTDFVTSAFGPTDLVALMDPLLPTDAIRWTRNRTDLSQAIQKLEGRYRVYMPVRSVLEEAQLYRRDVERLRSEVTVSAMKSAASYLGGLREGRKAIVFVSEGLPWLDRNDEASLIQDLVRTANDNNTAIYTLDPRGLGAGVADVMWTLAASTGASAFVNTNSPEKALRQVVVDASAFYLLGYASTKSPADGKFHQIKVRVKRSGIDVRARKGYWAPSTTDVDRAAREAVDGRPPQVSSAIATLSATRPERVLDLWAGATRAADGSAALTLTWTPRAGRTAGQTGSLAVTAHTADGDDTFEAPLASRRLSFAVRPGEVRLKVVVKDERGDTVDEDTRQISIPDLAQPALTLSSPAAILARNAAELRAVAAASVPFAGREFSRTDRLFVRFEVYGEAAADAVVTARLLSRSGGQLRTLTVQAPRNGLDAYEIDVPLGSLARGDFLIAIAAEAGDDRAEVLFPLRVI
jgi:VWFA-related protein